MNFKLLLILFVLIVSCKKVNDRNCWKKNGENKILNISQNEVDIVSIYDNISLTLINDSLDLISIKAPENLINLIELTTLQNELSIHNLNKCDFIRKPSEIEIFYHYTALNQVDLYGFGRLTNQNKIEHEIDVNSFLAYSNIELNLNNNSSKIKIFGGSSAIKINGNCDNLYCYNSGLGPVDAKNLTSRKIHIHSNSIANAEILASDTLIIEIRNNGSVYYSGEPSVASYSITGNGEIINL